MHATAFVKTLRTRTQKFQKRNWKIPARCNDCLILAPIPAAGVESDLMGEKNLRVSIVDEANHCTILRTAESTKKVSQPIAGYLASQCLHLLLDTMVHKFRSSAILRRRAQHRLSIPQSACIVVSNAQPALALRCGSNAGRAISTLQPSI
jgi:hypothetical protein